MPGIIQQENTFESSTRRRVNKTGDGHRNSGGGVTTTTTASSAQIHRGAAPDSYYPPYPRQPTTTAYGVNEPPVGPPPLVYERSPYARIPLPHMGMPGFPISVHPLLTAGNDGVTATRGGGGPSLIWCVNRPASDAQLSSSSTSKPSTGSSSASVPYHWKAMPALSPTSTSSLTIRVPFASRPIVVFPSTTTNNNNHNNHSGVITIGDVLNAVYAGLRQCANDVLCESVGISPLLLSAQLHAAGYAQMASQSSSFNTTTLFTGGDDEVSSHLSQCLDYKTRWVGLVPSNRERDVWVLITR